MLKYKEYMGMPEYDPEAHIFHGEVVGLNAVITFQGTSVEELEAAFRDSIDDYLDWCKERGVQPEKAYSGKLQLRMSPELHAKISSDAAKTKMSINSYIIFKLSA